MFSLAATTTVRLMGKRNSATVRSAPSTVGSAAHVEFHFVHGRRILERDAAGVEGNALAR